MPPLRRAQFALGRQAGTLAPLPALVNILIPAGTLLGWSAAPAQLGSWGLLDADETRAFARAATLSARTRFCMTLVAPDGTALAHGCSRGRPAWPPPPPARPRPAAPPAQPSSPVGDADSRGDREPALAQAQQLADLVRRLNITFRPISHGKCDHADAEDHYAPSRRLKHLIRARTATCSAPACNAQAVYCDLDHTVPHPEGPTLPVQPGAELPAPPPVQAGRRLEGRAAGTRRPPLDPPLRAHPHNRSHGPRPLALSRVGFGRR
jgi:hypothetical protein